jgi:hypothetical protein
MGTLLAPGVAATASFSASDFASTKLGHRLDLGGMSATGWIAGVALLTMPLLGIVGGVLGIGLRKPVSESMQEGEPKFKGECDGEACSK